MDSPGASTLVDSSPPHSSVGGMAGSAMGGYGSINMTHNGMMGPQGYNRVEGNCVSGAGENIWNDQTGRQMIMAHQSPFDLMVGEWGSPNNREHHMMQKGRQPQLYRQGHQPLQHFGRVNNIQQPHVQTQAQITLPLDYKYGGMQHYTTSAHGETQTMLV